MNAAEVFAKSIPGDHLEIYRFLPQDAQSLQDTLAHRIFRWSLRLRHGKNSNKYLRSSYACWTRNKQCNYQWDMLASDEKRVFIASSIKYYLYMRNNYPAWEFLGLFFRRHINYPLLTVDRVLSVFVTQRENNSHSSAIAKHGGRTQRAHRVLSQRQNNNHPPAIAKHGGRAQRAHVAFLLCESTASKCGAVNQLVQWLNLVVNNNFEFAVYFLRQVPEHAKDTLSNIECRVIPFDSVLLTSIEIEKPIFVSRMEGRGDLTQFLHLESILNSIDCDALAVFPEGTTLIQSDWQERLALFWYKWAGEEIVGPLAPNRPRQEKLT
jgi:hypothetical protein